MKDGAIVCNSGHFNVEIDLDGARPRWPRAGARVRPFVEEFTVDAAGSVYVLGEGRLINLAAAEGHPAAVMDMSFANQALAAEFMVKKGRTLERKVYGVPREIDHEIARLKLASMGVHIDELTRAAGVVPRLLAARHVGHSAARARNATSTPRRSSWSWRSSRWARRARSSRSTRTGCGSARSGTAQVFLTILSLRGCALRGGAGEPCSSSCTPTSPSPRARRRPT